MYIQPYNWKSGPQQTLKTLISKINRLKFEPYVVLPAQSSVADEFERVGAKVGFDSEVRTVPRSFSPTAQARFWFGTWKGAKRIADMIRDGNFQLVHVNSEACWVGGIAARIARKPAVIHLHGMQALSPKWMGFVTARVLNKCGSVLVAVSEEVRKAYLSCGASRVLMETIYNGIDVYRFDPALALRTLREELSVKDGQPLIGMIANFDPRKGHHEFVRACYKVLQQIPEARFVIVGDKIPSRDSGYYRQIERDISEHRLRSVLRILGSRDDMPNVLASLDVVVNPSLTEAGPLVPLETMAMERPIVVTDVGGNREEVIDGKTGLVVPVGDVSEMANAIVKLIFEPALAQRIGKAGRERVLNMFRDEIYAQKVQELYNRLLLEKSLTN
jgi:glycosyltransferase involved in cell wall biosynthesis